MKDIFMFISSVFIKVGYFGQLSLLAISLIAVTVYSSNKYIKPYLQEQTTYMRNSNEEIKHNTYMIEELKRNIEKQGSQNEYIIQQLNNINDNVKYNNDNIKINRKLLLEDNTNKELIIKFFNELNTSENSKKQTDLKNEFKINSRRI